MKHVPFAAAGIMIVFLALVWCTSSKNIQVQKEKIEYREKIENTLDKLERKKTVLELAMAEMNEEEADSVGMYVQQLDDVEENLNRKYGESKHVPENLWEETRREIDVFMGEYEEIVRKTKNLDGSH